jgi:thiosulfate/3-mercaptopyruvate sulfurtransferase
VDFETVRAALDTDAVVVDTREAWEYAEGHLPGAVQLDWRDLVDAETRGLKPDAELESLLAERGVTPDRRIVLYCNTARRISHTYVALRHLGYEHVDFYEGSLTEWEKRGGPIVSETDGDA